MGSAQSCACVVNHGKMGHLPGAWWCSRRLGLRRSTHTHLTSICTCDFLNRKKEDTERERQGWIEVESLRERERERGGRDRDGERERARERERVTERERERRC